MRFFICCFKSKHSSVSPMISVEAAILVLIQLVGTSLHIFQPLQRWFILDLHKHLIKWSVQRHIMLTPSRRRTCLPFVSIFLLSCLGLLWTRTLFKMAWEICFHSFSSLPLLGYDCILCIHETLG